MVLIDPEREVRRVVVGATHSAPALLANVTGGDDDLAAAIAAVAPGLDAYEQHIHAVAVTRALGEALG